MRNKSSASRLGMIVFTTMLLAGATAFGQSTNISYPTPVLVNEISGTINARDIGDSRLTSYFYTFLANQGDVFINVVTKNFNGDIDIFAAEGLRPLTKIVMYADVSDNETGRVVYFRKPERLILRVEGRSPNDDPATFKIKFAGSFEASKDVPGSEPELPEVKAADNTGIRVNSVGTILEVVPKTKPTPQPSETVAAKTEPPESKEQPVTAVESEPKAEAKASKVEVVVTDDMPAPKAPPPRVAKSAPAPARKRPRGAGVKAPPPPGRSSTGVAKVPTSPRTVTKTPAKPAEPDPLQNIFLIIEFKSGGKIERPMSEVLRMTVDRGVLTIVSRDGTIGRYSILDIAKTTIQ